MNTRRGFLKTAAGAVGAGLVPAKTLWADESVGRKTFRDDWDYLKRKWQEDVSDLSTGCDLPGDFPLDVALLPRTAAGEKGLVLMRAVVEQYFANGGLVIQFNVHDAATLRDAQRHPEKYENLQVRVSGWNVRWNDIPKAEQDKFILRAESITE